MYMSFQLTMAFSSQIQSNENPYVFDVVRYSCPVFIFWCTTQFGQRLCGLAKIQYGRRGSNVAGFCVVLSSAAATVFAQRTHVEPFVQGNVEPLSKQELIRTTYLSLVSFITLGFKPYSTILPSSVILLGSFNKFPHFPIPGKGSVPVASEAANAAQRTQIQRLGKLYGCHQCGSKQLFGQGSFISDHMPPTKQVKAENQRWYRRWLLWGLKQELWPQCQKCFSKQGSAVRMNIHESIYNRKLRPHHFCVLIALQVSSVGMVKDVMDTLVQDTLYVVDSSVSRVKDLWSQVS